MSNLANEEILQFINFTDKLHENDLEINRLTIQRNEELITQLEESLEDALEENEILKENCKAFSDAFYKSEDDLSKMKESHIPLSLAGFILFFYGSLSYTTGVIPTSIGFVLICLYGYIEHCYKGKK